MSRPQTSSAEVTPPPTISPKQRLVATIGMMLALALTSIDLSVVSAALPRIATDLNGLGLYSWVGVSYAVAAAVVLPIAGKLGDMFGRKPFLISGLIGFLLASFICGLAQTMTVLVAFRGVQGLFAGILMANIFTLIADIYTAERRAQMMGVFFGVSGFSMVIGPPLGGLITDSWNWRWIFYVNVPLCLAAGLAIMVGVARVRSRSSWREIDFLGVVTLVAGLVPILIGLSLAGSGHAWSSPGILVLLIGGAVLLAVFGLVEVRYAKNPIVPFSLFRTSQFTVMAVVAFFSAFAMMGAIFYVPLLLQGVLGSSATFAGSALSPMMLALMVVPPLASKAMTMISRYRFLGTAGFVCMVAGLLLLSQVTTGSGRAAVVVAMVLIGVGIGIAFPLATVVVQSAVPMKLMGVGTSQMQFWRMIAGPVSLAGLGTVMSIQIGGNYQPGGTVAPEVLSDALNLLFLIAAVVVTVGLVATLFLDEVELRKMPSMKKSKEPKEPTASEKPTESAEAEPTAAKQTPARASMPTEA